MTDPEALAKLATEATPGPWHSPGISLRPYTIYGPNDDDLARAWEGEDAAYIAAASPDVVLALVRVALAAKAFSEVAETAPKVRRPAIAALRAALADLDR